MKHTDRINVREQQAASSAFFLSDGISVYSLPIFISMKLFFAGSNQATQVNKKWKARLKINLCL
jgi:hypothetical protein